MNGSVLGRYESLSILTDTIAKQSKVVQDALKATGQEDVSMRDSDPSNYPIHTNRDKAFQRARLDLMEAARQMYELMMGPYMKMWNDPCASYHLCNVLRLFHLYKIPENVPLEGSISYADLSKKVNVNEDKLTRIIKLGITRNYFYQPEPGHVAHTTISRLLGQDPLARDLSGHFADDVYPASACMAEAWTKFGSDTEDPHKAALAVAPYNPKGLNAFEFLKDQPHREKRFGGAMQFLSTDAFTQSFLFLADQEFEWSTIGAAKIVDCGGGRGQRMLQVLDANPDATVVVEDLPSVVEQAKALPLPPQAQGGKRMTFQPWNFLAEKQPITDADYYYFAAIFHDWPDKECHVILKNLIPSMKKGARLLISDTVLTEPGELPYHWEAYVRQRDLQMMISVYSRERTAEQWKALIGEGAKGLEKDGGGEGLELESMSANVSVWRKV